MDLQIKLLSLCPLQGPAVTSVFVRGRLNNQATNLAAPLGKTLLDRKRDGGEEKGLPSHWFATLHLTMPYLSKSTHLSARQL